MEMQGEEKSLTIGKSILVPSVQELAKSCLNEIPERYIRSDQDPSVLVKANENNNDNLEIPIINMEALNNEDGVELEKLHLACQEWGFFQIINHGINDSLVEKFKAETKEFFNLPLQEKKRYWQSPTDVEGFGQAFVISEEQKLDWGDMFYLTLYPKHLRKPHLIPMLPPSFRNTLEEYSAEQQKLAKTILDHMAKALNIEMGHGNSPFGEGHQSIRMNYYPPCPQPDRVIGIPPHSDSNSLITILLQINEVEGLHVKKDNKWVPVKPLPHAFVVNVGDILEILTNGMYRSVLHTAVVNKTMERLSAATFHNPKMDHVLCPIPNLISSTNPAKFRRITMLDYFRQFLSYPLDGKFLDVLRINSQNDENQD